MNDAGPTSQAPLSPTQPALPAGSASRILTLPPPSRIRDELTDMVLKDLLGPAGGPSEELDKREDRVRERYLVGVLAPKAVSVEAGTMGGLGAPEDGDGEGGATDVSAPSANTQVPPSMGKSFLVGHD